MPSSRILQAVAWAGLRSREPGLAVAQVAELQRQVPLLYILLMVNASAVSYTHFGLAPNSLTLAVPGFLFLVCGVRAVVWLRKGPSRPTQAQSVAILRRTTILSAALSMAYVAWALRLDGYGGPYERGHVALFIAITVIGCIFCLMHLPQAAMAVTVIVTASYLYHYASSQNDVFVAIALNIALVTIVMVRVLTNNFAGFSALIRSKADLAAKQAESERLGEENARLAPPDSLTQLPNRRHFFAQLDALIERSARTNAEFAIGLLDLDRFKPVNDTYGHVFGDRLLADVGERLARETGARILVARLGGDEFGFLLDERIDEAREIGQRFCDLLGEAFEIEGVRIAIGCSCGLALYPEAGRTAHALFDRCDYALYNAKSHRRGGATLFAPEHETRIRSKRAIEAALSAADLSAEMTVHFQPIVDARTDAVVAVEALARWTSPSLGPVPPDQFITVAERAGLIHRLTMVLFPKALDGLKRLPADVCLSFNLSAQDISSPQTVLSVLAAIRQSGVDPRRVGLEVTETAVLRDVDAAQEGIALFRALGVTIALDDFGTGFSSLGHLHRLALDKVKLDRSFLADLDKRSGANIVKAVFGLCRTLELDCIAEGVETPDQRERLSQLGATLMQGYVFARPMPLEECLAWIEARTPVPRLVQA